MIDVENDEDVLAGTMYGEARGEYRRFGEAALEAVGHVVLNRKAQPRWQNMTVASICTQPFQFSCWLASDPNRERIMDVSENDPLWIICRRIAREVLAHQRADNTIGATHYHNELVMPKWARGHRPCTQIGSHMFYNDVR